MPYNLYAYDSYGTQTGSDYSNESFSSYKGYDKGPFGYKTGVRQYDPETGRFLSPDAFKGYLTDPTSQHPYMYCHGNPVKYSDPSGYWSSDEENRKKRQAMHLVLGGVTDLVAGAVITQLDSFLPGPRDVVGGAIILKGVHSIGLALKLSVTAKVGIAGIKTMSAASRSGGKKNYSGGSEDTYHFGVHSEERRKEFGLIAEDVIEALENAKSTFRGNEPNSRYIVYNRKFRIYFNPTTKKIISVVKIVK